MNTILTSDVVDPNLEQPWKATSLQFLEDSYLETFKNTIVGLIGSTYSASQVYILFGCVRSGAADGAGSGAAAVTAGAVFFNGEIYTMPAFSTGNIAGQTLYSVATVTIGSPDPTLFSDNTTSFNVHNVRRWVISQAGSGSNAFSTWIPYVIENIINTTTSNGVAVTASSAITYSGLTTYYSYYIRNKICYLNFSIDFLVTSGAAITYIRIPLPTGVVKLTGINTRYGAIGFATFKAPTGTTDYAYCIVKGIDDVSDGQYLQLERGEASATITMSNVQTTITGHINIPIA